ncbi:hypothetical protein DV113_001138 [Geotrichum candidum]|uniref:Uncharacterized protein n=1 Tax=Geotrichum candidum TaxID=1173061 RepID=A0A0J9XHG8_GEOCN|nr:hypothetical protein DV113_001138 [Geotrichum candidum]CDO56382.1 Hypothetical protein, no similarity [Geotrichum candidum]
MSSYSVNPDTQLQHALLDTAASTHAGDNVLKHFVVSTTHTLLNASQTIILITLLSVAIYLAARALYSIALAVVSRIRLTALRYGPKKLKLEDEPRILNTNTTDLEAQYESAPDLVSTPSSIGSPMSVSSPGMLSPAAMNDALKKLGVYSTSEYYSELSKEDAVNAPKILSSLYPTQQQHSMIKTH